MIDESAPLGPYPSPEALRRRLSALAEEAGEAPFSFGQSVEGRPLLALRLPPRPSGSTAAQVGATPARGAPRVLISANLHGLEFVGGLVALATLEALVQASPGSPEARLRSVAEVVVAPSLNPDGYARTWAQRGRGTVAELRTNARGVDLNRNFPRPGGAPPSRWPGAGSPRPGAATYRGPEPLSEPESTAIDALCARERFLASVSLHSFMGSFIPARTRDPADFRSYAQLCSAAANAQPRRRYRRIASRQLDVFTGEQEDHLHHHHRCWSTCLEVFPLRASLGQHLRAPSVFWRFNPRDPEPWIANDVPAVIAFCLAVLALGRRPGPRGANEGI